MTVEILREILGKYPDDAKVITKSFLYGMGDMDEDNFEWLMVTAGARGGYTEDLQDAKEPPFLALYIH